jgi:hypothetical protein
MGAKQETSWWERNVEDPVAAEVERERQMIPPEAVGARLQNDIATGVLKGVYGFGKGLIVGLADIAIVAAKLENGDPETTEKAFQIIKKLGKEAWIAVKNDPAEIADQDRRIGEALKGIGSAVYASMKNDWNKAEHDGKKAELISKWATEGVLNVAAFFVGAGEVRAAAAAGKAGELLETGEVLANVAAKCPEVLAAADEALAAEKALAAAKVAEEAAKAAKVAADAEKVGMETKHVEALVADCAERDRLAVYRKSNPESLKYHGEKAARAKPHEVEVLKTAKAGEKNAGLVVRPKNPNAKELTEIKKLEDAGWTFDEEGRLLDPDKNMIHGDYDMQGVYKEVGTDAQGKPIYEKVDTNSESSYFLEDQNEMITPERDMHQHGANDSYTKTGPNGEKVMGRTPGADETYLVVDKNGTQVIESTAELQKVYEANNIPWPY